jgi:hypothetical protein
MTAFLIKVPGQQPYHGIFPSQQQAAQDAENRFPLAPPAFTIRLTPAANAPRAAGDRA